MLAVLWSACCCNPYRAAVAVWSLGSCGALPDPDCGLDLDLVDTVDVLSMLGMEIIARATLLSDRGCTDSVSDRTLNYATNL